MAYALGSMGLPAPKEPLLEGAVFLLLRLHTGEHGFPETMRLGLPSLRRRGQGWDLPLQ